MLKAHALVSSLSKGAFMMDSKEKRYACLANLRKMLHKQCTMIFYSNTGALGPKGIFAVHSF